MAEQFWGGNRFQDAPERAGVGAVINHYLGTTPLAIRRATPGDQAIVLEAEVGSWRVLIGDHVARTFNSSNVNTATDQITITGHGYETGDGPLQLTDGGGGLPGGLSAGTNYWIVKIDDNTISLATSASRANRIKQTGVGSAAQSDAIVVDITSVGGAAPNNSIGGVNLVTLVAVAGAGNGILLKGTDPRPGNRLIVTARVVTVVGFVATDAIAYWTI